MTGNVYASSPFERANAGGLIGNSSNDDSISNSYYYSDAKLEAKTIPTYGVGLTLEEMTGIGEGSATEKMTDLSEDNLIFKNDRVKIKYLPCLNSIPYIENTNPSPRFLVSVDSTAIALAASDFVFKAPTNLAYNGDPKEAKVTSKFSEISDDKITVKYYNPAGTKLTPLRQM